MSRSSRQRQNALATAKRAERPTAEQVRAGFDTLARMLVEMSPALEVELFDELARLTAMRDRLVVVVAEGRTRRTGKTDVQVPVVEKEKSL